MPYVEKEYLTGLEATLRAFGEMPKRLARKHLRRGVNAIGKDLLWAAKARTPKRTGLLYKSLGRKVKSYRSGAVVVAIVGARKGFRKQVGVRVKDSRPGTKYPKRKGDPIYADPTKYLHLVNLGTFRSRAYRMLQEALRQASAGAKRHLESSLEDAVKEGAQS